jgi:trigger factor
MQFTLKDLGPCEKEIEISVPETAIKEALDKAFRELRTQMALPGFRPGKVPMSMIQSKFGAQVRHEVFHDLVKEGTETALREHKLDAISEPELILPGDAEGDASSDHDHDHDHHDHDHDHDHDHEDDGHSGHDLPEQGPLSYSIKVEVKPSFELPKYRGLTAELSLTPTRDEDVTEALKYMAARSASYESLDDAADLEKSDLIEGRLTISHEGVTTLDDAQIHFELDGDDPEEFRFIDERDVVARARQADGDPVPCRVIAPSNFETEHLRGQELDATLALDGIRRLKVPELNDDFAVQSGCKDLSDMREKFRAELELGDRRNGEARMLRQVLDQLVKEAQIPLPNSFVERNLTQRIQRATIDLIIKEKLSVEAAKERLVAEESRLREQIEGDLRGWYLIEALAKKEKIYCLESDLDSLINRIAEEHNAKPSDVHAYYERENRMNELRTQIIEEKVLAFLKAQISVTEVVSDRPSQSRESEASAD